MSHTILKIGDLDLDLQGCHKALSGLMFRIFVRVSIIVSIER